MRAQRYWTFMIRPSTYQYGDVYSLDSGTTTEAAVAVMYVLTAAGIAMGLRTRASLHVIAPTRLVSAITADLAEDIIARPICGA